jgi:hypothetical protein
MTVDHTTKLGCRPSLLTVDSRENITSKVDSSREASGNCVTIV